ncbi:MAG: hypothetical protein ACRECP_09620, partial [Methylocella sp.]
MAGLRIFHWVILNFGSPPLAGKEDRTHKGRSAPWAGRQAASQRPREAKKQWKAAMNQAEFWQTFQHELTNAANDISKLRSEITDN